MSWILDVVVRVKIRTGAYMDRQNRHAKRFVALPS